jgi:hypothetical protein
LKYLSKGRKRNQNEIPLVETIESGKVQTKLEKECGVRNSRTFNNYVMLILWKK